MPAALHRHDLPDDLPDDLPNDLPVEGPVTALDDVPADGLGESPLWHPVEQVLYWIDIPGRRLCRFDPARSAHREWPLPSEPGCCAALLGGGLLLAMRDGLWRFDTERGERSAVAVPPPYDPARQRYNDVVMEYNNRRQGFPGVIFAGMFSFLEGPYWKIEAAVEREAPKVSF